MGLNDSLSFLCSWYGPCSRRVGFKLKQFKFMISLYTYVCFAGTVYYSHTPFHTVQSNQACLGGMLAVCDNAVIATDSCVNSMEYHISDMVI